MADRGREIEFEDILQEIGDFGTYQKRLSFFFLLPVAIIIPWFSMSIIFMVYIPDHWCYVSEVAHSNLTVELQRKLIAPKERSSCFMYDLNYTAEMLPGNFQVPNDTAIIPCNRGWQYDTTYFEDTAATKWNMVCHDLYYSSLVLTLANVGSVVFTPIYGYLSDRFGRKAAFLMLLLITTLSNGASLLVNSLAAFLVIRTINGSISPSTSQSVFLMMIEIVGPPARTAMSFTLYFAWGIGMCVLPLIAYLSKDWLTLGWVISGASLLMLCYWRLLPQSPRWLIAKEKYVKAEAVLNKMAKSTGRTPVDLMKKIQILGEKIQKEKTMAEKNNSPADLFRYPNVRKAFLIMCFYWVSNNLTYSGLQLNAENLSGNPFFNFFLLAVAEIPGYIYSWFIMAKIGRRFCAKSSVLFIGLACIVAAVTPEDIPYVKVTFSMIGKFGAAAGYMAMYQMSSELYPTTLRAIGLGLNGSVGQIGTTAAPYVAFLSEYGKYLPFLVIGCVSLAASIGVCFVPETLNVILPQTISDAENFKNKRICPCYRWKKPISISCQEQSTMLLKDETHEQQSL